MISCLDFRKQAEADYQSAKEAKEAQRRLEEEKRNAEEQRKSKFEDLKVCISTRNCSHIRKPFIIKSKKCGQIHH